MSELAYPINPSESERKEAEAPTEVMIKSGDTEAQISPEKGALVTSLKVDDQEVLYVDREAFEDLGNLKPKTGIPNLLPYAGPKEGGPQHGGARELSWVWKDQTEDSTTVSLDFESLSEKIKGQLRTVYGEDFRFKTEMKIKVEEEKLSYEIVLTNKSETPKKFAPGLHPYFAIDHNRRSEMQSNIPSFDASGDLTKAKKLNIPKGEDPWFTTPDGKKITISSSPEFKHLVLWANSNDVDHVCVEPFVADPHKEEEFITLGPNESRIVRVEFIVEKIKEKL